jgi:uncharacterized delta-60 repeat protein
MGTLTLDKTFSLTGKLTENVGGDDIVTGLVIQPDGKIIATGIKTVSSGATDFYLRRYNRDGSSDQVFNTNASSTGGSTPSLGGTQSRDSRALIQQSNFLYVIGNILNDVSGAFPPEQQIKIFVAKYSLDGVLQQSFGGGTAEGGQAGFSIFGVGLDDYEASSATIQSDGKILVTGSVKRVTSPNATAEQDIVLLRFTSSGILDTTFGELTGSQRSGRITLNAGSQDVSNSVKLQKIGVEDRIVVIGSTGESGSENFTLARYTSSGDLDGSFGSAGIVTTNFGTVAVPASSTSDVARDLLILDDNKILVVGSVDSSTSTGGLDFAIARYSANGLLDTTFGVGGKLVVNASVSASGDDFAVKIVRETSGKILIVGSAQASSTASDTALLRLNADGTLDTGFGIGGIQLTPVGPGSVDDTGLTLAISPQDNSVVIGGGSKPPQPPGQPAPSGDSFIIKYEGLGNILNTPDLNNDGRRDFIWRNKSASNGLIFTWYLGGQSGTEYQGQNQFARQSDQNWQIVATGDFNKDGKSDILWRNSASGISLFWYMNGTDVVSQKVLQYSNGQNIIAQGSYRNIKGSADFNKDGNLDILWKDDVTGQVQIWNLTGADGATYLSDFTVNSSLAGAWDIRAINDFNRDGNPDIVWRNSATGSNSVWYMGGTNGNELKRSSDVSANPRSNELNWDIVGSGDFNNDGQADLLWRNQVTGQNEVWMMAQASALVTKPDQYSFGVGTVPTEWTLSIGDLNNDGRSDFIWRNKSSSNGLIFTWYLGGQSGTSYQDQSQFARQTDQNWQVVATGDFNKDGQNDLLWRNSASGICLFWYMNGTNRVSEKILQYSNGENIIAQGSYRNIRGSSDFNRDGNLDILWEDDVTGQVQVWNLTGADSATYLSDFTVNASLAGSWDVRTINDFDRDGNTDIIWRNSATGVNSIWYMGGVNGTERKRSIDFSGNPRANELNWDIVGSGDFDKDGQADLVWRNLVTGQNEVWLMSEASTLVTQNGQYAFGVGTVSTDWQLI